VSIFEHVSVLVSIILGLAVVHLLGGISLILDRRVEAKAYGVHLAWTANLLFVSILVWLGNFLLADVGSFRIFHFLNIIAYCITIYLMAGLLFPVHGDEVTDFREHFHTNRRRFFTVGIFFVVFDAIDGLFEWVAVDGGRLNPGQYATLAVYLILFLVGRRRSDERFHRIAAGIFFLGLLGWLQSLVRAGVVDV